MDNSSSTYRRRRGYMIIFEHSVVLLATNLLQ